jgi:hypothetical protein
VNQKQEKSSNNKTVPCLMKNNQLKSTVKTKKVETTRKIDRIRCLQQHRTRDFQDLYPYIGYKEKAKKQE